MLVGRDAELAVLNKHFRQMLDGRGSVLFLTGEAGLGKTTLVHTWWEQQVLGAADDGAATTSADARRGEQSALFCEAACSIPIGNVDVGELEALQPWIDVTNALVRDAPEFMEAHKKTGKQVKRFDISKFMIDTAPSWVTMIPVLGPSVGAALEILGAGYDQVYMHKKYHVDQGAAGVLNQQQVFQQYVNMLTKLAEEMPLVVFLDDMHWADASSTNLLFYLSRLIAQKRILVIATLRADDAVAANGGKGHPILTVKNEVLRYQTGDELVLGYLNASAIRQLLRALFPGYTVDDRFELWLRKISDGNALFVTQFVNTLREDGRLNATGTFIGSYDEITVPRSALAVVEERTRRLDDSTRELLSCATVEGVEFTMYVLERLSERKPMQLFGDLQRASSQGLIIERGESRLFGGTPTEIFAFSHALFHQVLYNSLLAAQRNHLHRACYALLRTEWDRFAQGATARTALATKLLVHAEKCGEWNAVADIAGDAAEQFWKTFAEDEALEMIGKVIDASLRLASTAPGARLNERHADALFLRAQIERLRGRFDNALTSLDDAMRLFHDAGMEARVVDCTCARASVHYAMGTYADALHVATEALHAAESLDYRAGSAMALNLIGTAHVARSAYDDALECFARSLALSEELADKRGQATTLNNTGAVWYGRGDTTRAHECYTKSLAISESLGDRAGAASALQNLGNIQWMGNHPDKAQAFYAASLGIREEIGDRAGEANVLNNIGAVAYTQEEYSEAREYFSRGLRISEEIGDRAGIALGLNNLGTVHRMLHDYSASREALNRAVTVSVETGSTELRGAVLCELGLLEEMEFQHHADPERAAALQRAAAFLADGVALLEETGAADAVHYQGELDRVRKNQGQ